MPEERISDRPPSAAAVASRSGTDNDHAVSYLSSLIDRELGIHVTDGRIFVGRMKCTDRRCNVVLSNTFEYRQPQGGAGPGSVRAEMPKRYVGLIVVPGEYVTKVELTP